MHDPRDEERRRALAEEERPDTGAPDGAEAGDRLGPEEPAALLVRGRPALSDEIARRWDPARLVRMVSRGAGRGEPLDATTRAHFERRLGVDLGGVRVYTGGFAEQVTARHGAEAVTVGGTGMIFMSGTPDRSPATAAGRSLLAHELTHVAQSTRGVYRSAPGEPVPLATAEHEAEAEREEAEEERLQAGGTHEDLVDPERSAEELLAVVTSRVLELLHDEERVHALRNGEARIRV